MITIILKPYVSTFFPVLAEYTLGSVKQSRVYTTKEAAVAHLTGRFGDVLFIDKMNTKEKAGR